jgi:hypothetical protein
MVKVSAAEQRNAKQKKHAALFMIRSFQCAMMRGVFERGYPDASGVPVPLTASSSKKENCGSLLSLEILRAIFSDSCRAVSRILQRA